MDQGDDPGPLRPVADRSQPNQLLRSLRKAAHPECRVGKSTPTVPDPEKRKTAASPMPPFFLARWPGNANHSPRREKAMPSADAPRERGRLARILIPAIIPRSTPLPYNASAYHSGSNQPRPPPSPGAQGQKRCHRLTPPGARASRPHPYSCKHPAVHATP